MAVACLQPDQQWFALRVRAKAEATVQTYLQGRGFETLCPTYRDRRNYSDRIKTVDAALFPGYLFCYFNVNHRLPILTAPGVEGVIGFGGQPHPIEEGEMAALFAIIRSGVGARPHPFLRVGQRVRVESGPLSQLEGILVGEKSDYRLLLSLSLLQRSIVAEIDSAHVRPL